MVRQMQAEIAREREAHALSWQALEAKVSTQPSLCVLSDAGLTRHCGPASIFLWSLHLLRSRAAPIRRRRRTRPRRVRTSRRGRRDRDCRRSLGGRAVWLVLVPNASRTLCARRSGTREAFIPAAPPAAAQTLRDSTSPAQSIPLSSLSSSSGACSGAGPGAGSGAGAGASGGEDRRAAKTAADITRV